MQKLRLAAIFFLPLFFLLAGCDSSPTGTEEPKNENKTDSRLVGEWECYKAVLAGIAQEFPKNARTKVSFTSDGHFDMASTNEGTWRTSNDSLYLKSSINNVESFYAIYEISGSEIIFTIAGQKYHYKKTGEDDGPNDPNDPNDDPEDIITIEKEELYGKWTCYSFVNELEGIAEDPDFEISFSETKVEVIEDGIKTESSSWYIEDYVIIIKFDDEFESEIALPILSLSEKTLTVGMEDVFYMHFKKS